MTNAEALLEQIGIFVEDKYTLQWVIKEVLFEASSKDAVERAIADLDAAWDARAK